MTAYEISLEIFIQPKLKVKIRVYIKRNIVFCLKMMTV